LVRLGKLDVPVSNFRQSSFDSFNVVKKEVKLKDLNIQWNFKHGKRRQGIKEPRQRNFKPEVKVTKIGWSGLRFWIVQFL
jgi:hypothetical protein